LELDFGLKKADAERVEGVSVFLRKRKAQIQGGRCQMFENEDPNVAKTGKF
jgi:hypothetical protein